MAGGLTRITVRLTPRAGRDAIDGWVEDARGARVLGVRVAAPPAEGRANEALVRLLAKALGVAPSRVRITAGAQARTKVVEVEGMSAEHLRGKFIVHRSSSSGGAAAP